MNSQPNKKTQYIQDILNENSLTCKVLELPSSTRTASDAAQTIGCNISQIVKSLIFKTKITNRPILVLVSGANKVDEKQLAIHIQEDIIKADAYFVKEVTGFAIGGVAPIGYKNLIDLIYIDYDLTVYNEVWAAAGKPNAVFYIKSKDLIKITEGKVLAMKQRLIK